MTVIFLNWRLKRYVNVKISFETEIPGKFSKYVMPMLSKEESQAVEITWLMWDFESLGVYPGPKTD